MRQHNDKAVLISILRPLMFCNFYRYLQGGGTKEHKAPILLTDQCFHITLKSNYFLKNGQTN